ncbi:cysteine dioxygenase [Thraustotheca clavata]|uniref:Cysteine dioxygenase n=1 Tax=Thraustotheca clavata TaxID=74557 RepID=A0A1V9ZS23_9STRA|nr:cysteine dioxygenase [Thraustotheca clavata]
MSTITRSAKRKATEEETTRPSKRSHVQTKKITLKKLVDTIERVVEENSKIPLEKMDEIKQALMDYDGNMDELKRYSQFDASRNYTRNLIATDNEAYALMLLCWNKGKYSPIHDHPSDGCWVRHIQGTVNEVRYQNNGKELVESSNMMISEGVSFMTDALGLHKIGNPSQQVDAITLHLYAPPYDKCKLWFDPSDATKVSTAVSNFYTEYGELTN